MPNQPKTPARSVRVGVELWDGAKAAAATRGEAVTDVIVRALREYVARVEWEQGMARQAMDSGPVCVCGHGQMEHGEMRCGRCGCGLAWSAREFEQKEAS